jgi:1-deoxy-D-xylulose-5-phosphate synthase
MATLVQVVTQRVAALPDVDDFFWEKDPTPILDTIDAPIHLKNLSSKVVRVILIPPSFFS